MLCLGCLPVARRHSVLVSGWAKQLQEGGGGGGGVNLGGERGEGALGLLQEEAMARTGAVLLAGMAALLAVQPADAGSVLGIDLGALVVFLCHMPASVERRRGADQLAALSVDHHCGVGEGCPSAACFCLICGVLRTSPQAPSSSRSAL